MTHLPSQYVQGIRRRTNWISLTLLVMLIAFFLLLPGLLHTARVNIWSVNWLEAKFPTNPGPDQSLPLLPTAHPRHLPNAVLNSLASGDLSTATRLVDPLLAAGDPLSVQLAAATYQEIGDYESAISIWESSRNEVMLFKLAKAAINANDLSAAQKSYYAAWNLQPQGDSTAELAQFLWRKRNDPDAAEEVLRWSLSNCSANARVSACRLIQGVPL